MTALLDIARLVTAYCAERPDAAVPGERVAFGTSGHRGSAFDRTFNEWHVAAISQAIAEYRRMKGIDGPLFLGLDTHALSEPAGATALEVLAANGVTVMVSEGDEFTPTPAVSHAIIRYNLGRTLGLADGIVVTPSHNPPEHGGFKYNPPNGGPADSDITKWIETRANELLAKDLAGVKRIPYRQAVRAPTTHRYDYLRNYVEDLGHVLDMDAIRSAGVKIGVDPLGGAGVHYWGPIAERYRIDLTVLNDVVDRTFRFMALDWDGQIRMDPSSKFVMRPLIEQKDRFDVVVACDTDHDRHGIVTRSAGLLPSNHYLAVSIHHLFRHRPDWQRDAAVGKTVVSSTMIDRVCARLGRRVYEVPIGFKWFAAGLSDGSLGFGGEESAGSSFLRRGGTAWSTDKDGIIAALLAAEITAVEGRDPGEIYAELERAEGATFYTRVEAKATPAQKKRLGALTAPQFTSTELAGEKIGSVISAAPGNGAALGGIKVSTAGGWFAARPSGTEDIYKIYAESFLGDDHLNRLVAEAQAVVDRTIAG